jgi:hypothetical protein
MNDSLTNWNFRHIVRRKAKEIIRILKIISNLKIKEILTPAPISIIFRNAREIKIN